MVPFYQDEAVCIYHGDCREVLPFLPKSDLLLTDPPYGIDAASKSFRGSRENGWRDYGDASWDAQPIDAETLAACIAKCRTSIVWGGNYFALPPSMGWLVWDKGQRNFSLADGELAWTSEARALRIFEYARGRQLAKEARVHPTQKPVELMLWCIGLFPEAKAVLDPFMGSGTTLVAAKRLGRKAIGIERERAYCELAVERLRQSALPLMEEQTA